MPNWGIREAIQERVRRLTLSQLSGLIQEAQRKQQEKNLPGLGVFFELLWNNSNEEDRNRMLNTLHQSLQKAPVSSSQESQ